ncbi:MAG: acetate--CoA ligase family protein, partial [Actinomycetes bacterium]
ANPVDTGRPGPELGQVLRAVAADPAVDLVAGYALHEPDAVDLVAAVRDGRIEGVPVVLGLGGTGDDVTAVRQELLDVGVAVHSDAHGVAAGIGALLADAGARSRRTGDLPVPPRLHLEPGPYDEHRAKLLLDELGFATPPRRACADRAQAHAALAELGGPVAVKLLDAAVLHKTEIRGVHLDIPTGAELDDALDRLDAVGATRYLVERMAPGGVDLVLGARRDPVFGPIVLLGLGGTAAEALADVAIRLAPLAPEDAAEMPAELGGRALLSGWRGGPTLDPAELATLVAAVGNLLAHHPTLDEIEINPLRLTDCGLIALDAVVRTSNTSEEPGDAQPDH